MGVDTIHLPARYDGLSETDLQAHFRHCASALIDGDRVELLLNQAGVQIPAVKRIYRTKSAALFLLLRSGSIERKILNCLRRHLESNGHDLTISVTKKRKLLSRIAVRIPLDDSLFALSAIKVLETVALQLGSTWPQPMSAGYRLGSEGIGLPGHLTINDPILNASRNLGRAMGKFIGNIIR